MISHQYVFLAYLICPSSSSIPWGNDYHETNSYIIFLTEITEFYCYNNPLANTNRNMIRVILSERRANTESCVYMSDLHSVLFRLCHISFM